MILKCLLYLIYPRRPLFWCHFCNCSVSCDAKKGSLYILYRTAVLLHVEAILKRTSTAGIYQRHDLEMPFISHFPRRPLFWCHFCICSVALKKGLFYILDRPAVLLHVEAALKQGRTIGIYQRHDLEMPFISDSPPSGGPCSSWRPFGLLSLEFVIRALWPRLLNHRRLVLTQI